MKEQLKLYVIHEPYYALLSAEDNWEAFELYEETVCDLYDADEPKWLNEKKTVASPSFRKAMSEFLYDVDVISPRVATLIHTNTGSEDNLDGTTGRLQAYKEVQDALNKPTVLSIDVSLI